MSFRPTLVVIPTNGRNLLSSAPITRMKVGGGRERSKRQHDSGSAVPRRILGRRQSRKKYVPRQTESIRDHVQ
jgi:hypothetical protein